VETQTTPYCIEIPGGLSFLATHNFEATIAGLDTVAKTDWPPVRYVHISFQIMVMSGMALMGMGAWTLFLRWKKIELQTQKLYLKATVLAAPLGVIAVETGWMVTELGRQPWVIHNVLRVSKAVTPVPGIVYQMWTYSLVYLFLIFVVLWIIGRQIDSTAPSAELGVVEADDHVG